MKREDVAHLATLARVELSPEELDRLPDELTSIMAYVGVISDIAGESADMAPRLGARYNVFRPDEVTRTPDQYTADVLAEMPETEGRFMKVKKILGGTE